MCGANAPPPEVKGGWTDWFEVIERIETVTQPDVGTKKADRRLTLKTHVKL